VKEIISLDKKVKPHRTSGPLAPQHRVNVVDFEARLDAVAHRQRLFNGQDPVAVLVAVSDDLVGPAKQVKGYFFPPREIVVYFVQLFRHNSVVVVGVQGTLNAVERVLFGGARASHSQ